MYENEGFYRSWKQMLMIFGGKTREDVRRHAEFLVLQHQKRIHHSLGFSSD